MGLFLLFGCDNSNSPFNESEYYDLNTIQIGEVRDLDIFDDMLKNLAEEEPVSKTQNREELKDLKNENQDQLYLSPILIRKIVEQIYFHWMRPPGLKKSDDMSVQIRIHLRTDGTIKKIIRSKQVLKKLNNRTYLVYLEAAERALRRLEKFDGLPTNKYSTWKTIELNFKPY